MINALNVNSSFVTLKEINHDCVEAFWTFIYKFTSTLRNRQSSQWFIVLVTEWSWYAKTVLTWELMIKLLQSIRFTHSPHPGQYSWMCCECVCAIPCNISFDTKWSNSEEFFVYYIMAILPRGFRQIRR